MNNISGLRHGTTENVPITVEVGITGVQQEDLSVEVVYWDSKNWDRRRIKDYFTKPWSLLQSSGNCPNEP